MENDEEAYLANRDIGIDPTSARSTHPNQFSYRYQQPSRSHGHKGVHSDEYEDTPLLSRDIDASSEPTTSDRGDNNGRTLDWSGANDFAGKPWWNRPSVRVSILWTTLIWAN